MWTLLCGGDGARMRALVDDFNASQREVRVVSTTLKWGEPFYTKLITASVVGAGPDLATVHLSRLVNLAGGGVLRPITRAELAAVGLRGGDYLPRQWAKSRWQGRDLRGPARRAPAGPLLQQDARRARRPAGRRRQAEARSRASTRSPTPSASPPSAPAAAA